MRSKHQILVAALSVLLLVAAAGIAFAAAAGDGTAAASSESDPAPGTTTTLDPATEDSLVSEIQRQADNDWGTTTTTIDEEALAAFLTAVADAEAQPPAQAVQAAPAPPVPAPAPSQPLAPSCSTWSSQEEVDAWMAENAGSHDTSNIDTNHDGRACTLHFAPPPTDPPAGNSAPAPSSTSGANWDALAQCESGGNWSINTGNGFYGGLQVHPATWAGFGGHEFASNAHLASREQQIAIAEKVLAAQGRGAWPGCSNSGAW